MTRKLTPKQQLFATEYLKDFNATQAAARAGYSERTAKEQGHQLLNLPHVQLEIDRGRLKAVQKVEVSIEKVLRDLEEARALAMELRQISAAVRASELHGKYLKMFFDGHQVETDMSRKSAAELRAELKNILDRNPEEASAEAVH